MSTFKIKQGDTARTITDTLQIDGDPIDLTGATVSLVYRNTTTGDVTVREAAVVTAAAGTVSYEIVAEDSSTTGQYLLEWHITFPDDSRLTVPTVGMHTMIVAAHIEEP